MAKKSMVVKQQRKQKYAVREYTRCARCGRPHAVLKKYGPNAKKIFHNKAKQTCIERYGVDNAMKSEQYKEKSKQTLFQFM